MSSVPRVASIVKSWAKALHRPKAAAFSTAAARPENVGILAMETYVASRAVKQADLEKADGVSAGKYTIGLGQQRMAFVDDREDINSVCMTAVQRLLDNYGIDPTAIGRLEVGTETLVDKSKSTKTTIMKLLEGAGNRNVEGATVINACYGGTAAFFNSAAWVESSEWDGRYALFVAGDIAVYEAGPARPTGGVGAVACLVGPGAPLRLLPRSRASHAVDVYDFYKPSLGSEYPAVDGKLSQSCYLRAVDDCYATHQARMIASHGTRPAGAFAPGVGKAGGGMALAGNGLPSADASYDHVLFHSPYNKLVQQSFRRMLYNDARAAVAAGLPLPAHLAALEPFVRLPADKTYANRDLDKALAGVGGDLYAASVGPSEGLSKAIGNSYTGALWANLASITDALGGALDGRRLGMFSYGSGAIASMFAMDAYKGSGAFSLDGMKAAMRLQARLDARTDASPAEFTEALAMRERTYGKSGYTPAGSVDNVPAGGWFLKEVKADHTRVYDRKA